ncbi:hypothetical protein LTR91_009941 [Friedmanniomyces endolithicus]|uniref:Uncharacterized protein n=1 Tax=Friedmanniomyces endolithicus TaxID=329885 RepID=A0AAN6QTW7_9PEZI|nr:hypothetical protein LTR94_002690 [Friedmanniomyces endolithicus]KAK0784983.1 hypothetical protein LTR38_012499 [Friedmanniomyces endolithicus]KAK0794555.1 hypothetical protein LTR59_007740 [Friedmanniomyces endolithicus]KAK0797886.1 hypothetical protein LTR75_009703 [Friedmanniomyces endolithicus]KAK0849051.1 hypothetical protein LTR03_005376 [Friedmanniomyces endolithicus]
MFATRNHNENAIYEQQTAAAAKPLNQGVKGLAPKTPGYKAPKTPFKGPSNDENAAFGNGKTGGKAKDGGLFGQGKGGKVDQSAFVTPAGPRTRAPLGNKTTNAKATLLQTPAGTTTKPSAQPTSPRLRRGKVKIHTALSDPLDNGNEEREIEYMAPRGVPLPDHPDDWPHDRTYPQFEGENLTRGWWAEFGGEGKGVASDEEMSDFDEKVKQVEARQRTRQAAGKVRSAAVERHPATIRARGAASALSTAALPKQRSTPGFAAPTAAAKARLPTAPVVKRSLSTHTTAPGNMRHTVAKVASNTTLGYSKGRAVSASARQPLSAVHAKPAAGRDGAREIAMEAKVRSTTLDELLGIGRLSVSDEPEAEDGLSGFDGDGGAPVLDLDDGLDDFQLASVEE